MKRFLSILQITMLFFSFTIPQTFSLDKIQEAEDHYLKALEFVKKGESKLAIQELQSAIKLNKKLAKAYNQLALIYMDEGTVHGRFKATNELAQALKLEPKNIEFIFNDAILNLKKGFTYAAEKQFKKIIKFDSENFQAYYQLAALKEEAMLHYQDMISIEPGSDGIIFMNSFAKKLYEKAAEYYQKAISINPKFSAAYYRVAMIFYEFKNFEEMIQLLESAVKIIPDDKNCHLFLGFAYQNAGKFQQATEEYHIAKGLMSPAERESIESINYLLTPEQMDHYQLLSPSEKQKVHDVYWRSRDPFYMTETNERELEHFSRIAYANLRFSKPQKKIEGWQTDRGKVFIRFGKPKYKYRTRPYIGEFGGNDRNPLNHSKEYWIYPDFHFVFEDRFLSDNFTFAWGDQPENDYKEIYNEMIKRMPDYYELIPDSEAFDVPLDMVAFQGQNGKTELELCYSVPAKQITPSSRSHHYKLEQGIFLYDRFWNPVIQRTKELTFQAGNIDTVSLQPYFNSHDLIEVTPGEYHFALEFEDQKSGKRSKNHWDVQVDTFFNNQFQLSEILFAIDIQPPNLNVPPARSDFKIIPNPLKVYRKGVPIVVYYEMYQLSQDMAGSTRFKIEFQVGEDFYALPSWKKLLTNVGLIKRKGEVTSSYEYSGDSPVELQYQKILLDSNMTGRIKLTLRATDLSTGSSQQKQETFLVIE